MFGVEARNALQAQVAAAVSDVLTDFFTDAAAASTAPPSEHVVTLWASEIAGSLGKDTWLSRAKALGRVWRRTHELQYRAVVDRWKALGYTVKGTEPLVHASLIKDPFPYVKTTADVELFKATAKPADVLKLFRTKGLIHEGTATQLLEMELGQSVVHRQAATTWRSADGVVAPVCSISASRRPPGSICDPGPFQVLGQVDGWLTTPPFSNTIVEVKVRMTTVDMESMPDHDRLQIQAYMHLNDAEQCAYTQMLLGTDTVHTRMIPRDPEVWENEILPGLRAFVVDVRKLLRGTDPEDFKLRQLALEATEGLPPPPRMAVTPTALGPPTVRPLVRREESPPRSLATQPVVHVPTIPMYPTPPKPVPIAPKTSRKQEEETTITTTTTTTTAPGLVLKNDWSFEAPTARRAKSHPQTSKEKRRAVKALECAAAGMSSPRKRTKTQSKWHEMFVW